MEKEKPFDFVSNLGEKIFDYPTENILKSDYFMEEFQQNVL